MTNEPQDSTPAKKPVRRTRATTTATPVKKRAAKKSTVPKKEAAPAPPDHAKRTRKTPVRRAPKSKQPATETPTPTPAAPVESSRPPAPESPAPSVPAPIPVPVSEEYRPSAPRLENPATTPPTPPSDGPPRTGQDALRHALRNRNDGGRRGNFRNFRNRNHRHDRQDRGGDPRFRQETRPPYEEGEDRLGDPLLESPLAENQEPIFSEGVLEVSGKGFGFMREAKNGYAQTPADVFVTPETVRNFSLRDGLLLHGEIRRGNRGPQLVKLLTINGEPPEKYQNLPVFEELTVINPIEWIRLETTPERVTTRIIDLMAPIGKGQRGLIVAPPRTGKTTLLEHIAEAVKTNHPDIHLMFLLVDERPEEVTAIRRTVPGAEIMASSNDSDLKSHTRIAQLAIDRARRLVEAGRDVFILLDSITRVGRAFNNAFAGSGRTLSGGMDARAMEIPRRLFASARNTEEAGSLTIIATALVETGSRMDELIFQEFKGTGNMELSLDRRISDQRIYPAVNIFLSGTRREELLLPSDALDKIAVIRRGLSGHKPIEAVERLLSFLNKFPTNSQMLREIPAG